MRWPLNYVVSIALHALVLFGLMLPVAVSIPKAETPNYLEVTLTAAPEPEPPPLPEPPPELPPLPAPEPSAMETFQADPGPAAGEPLPLPPQAPSTPAPLPRSPKAPPAPARLGSLTQWGSGDDGKGRGGRGRGPDGRMRIGNGHFYEAVYTPEGISWDEARKIAVKRGGYLATLTSPQENDYVFKLIDDSKYWTDSARNSYGPWLGGLKELNRGAPITGWEWEHKEGAFAYRNWAGGEPNNLGRRESRLQFFSTQRGIRKPTWNDLNQNVRLKGFVVEYDHDPEIGLRRHD